jgi:hypothetical protein
MWPREKWVNTLRLILIASIVVTAGCASTPQPIDSAESYYFDCDTAPGAFSDWNRTIAAASIRVTGTIELREPRQDPKWIPAANIWFIGAIRSQQAGIQASVQPNAPDELQIRLIQPSAPIVGPIPASVEWKGNPAPFSMSLSGSNSLSVTVAGKSQSISLTGFSTAKFSMTCSTADFHFKDVTVVTGH